MSIDWTDEAIGAFREYIRRNISVTIAHIAAADQLSAALDATVKAQGLDKTTAQIMVGYTAGRSEAFEEAARKMESLKGGAATDIVWQAAADEIRKLAKEPPK